MSEFTKDEINELLNPITDIYIGVDSNVLDISKSYVYLGSQLKTKEFNEYEQRNSALLEKISHIVMEQYTKSKNKKDIRVSFNGHSFRCNSIDSIEEVVIACRHMPYEFMTLDKLGLAGPIQKEMLHERLNKGGLIFICGAPGNGKSTTSAALVKERLIRFAGLCIAIEDPIEIDLHGKHGDGRCIQVPVITDFNDAIRNSMRSYPTGQNNMLFLGEIRDTETAINALQSALDGRLVLTTFHTDTINNAFERLITLAGKTVGEDEAHNLVAETFRFGLHQRLVKLNGKISLRPNVLVDTQEVYSNIREKRLQHLQNERERQFLSLKQNNQLDYRKR